MFFLRYLEREISIHPSFFGSNIHDFLTKKLYEDMEGSCNGEYYIICIMDIYNISAGKVRTGTGVADFTILYRAILWKPFKGEAVSVPHLLIYGAVERDREEEKRDETDVGVYA